MTQQAVAQPRTAPVAAPQTPPLRVGIVGMGRVGRRRAALVEQHPDLALHSVCDVDSERLAAWPSVRHCDDYRRLLDDPELDVIFSCAFNNLAPEVVCGALASGKHVFCEKPPGRSVADVHRMIEAERANPRQKLQFGFNHRYHYSVLEARSLVESGRYGRVLWVRGVYGKCGSLQFENEWRSDVNLAGGGILLDQGIHMLDLCRLFCGDFEQAKSVVTTAHWNIPCEDNAFAILSNAAGRVAMLHSSATQWKHTFRLEICMEDGYVHLNGILSSTRSYGDEMVVFARKQFEDTSRAFGRPREETIVFDTDDSWALEMDAFATAVREDKPVESGDSRDALRVMELIEAIYRDGGADRVPPADADAPAAHRPEAEGGPAS